MLGHSTSYFLKVKHTLLSIFASLSSLSIVVLKKCKKILHWQGQGDFLFYYFYSKVEFRDKQIFCSLYHPIKSLAFPLYMHNDTMWVGCIASVNIPYFTCSQFQLIVWQSMTDDDPLMSMPYLCLIYWKFSFNSS